jgi:hypothetical protein
MCLSYGMTCDRDRVDGMAATAPSHSLVAPPLESKNFLHEGSSWRAAPLPLGRGDRRSSTIPSISWAVAPSHRRILPASRSDPRRSDRHAKVQWIAPPCLNTASRLPRGTRRMDTVRFRRVGFRPSLARGDSKPKALRLRYSRKGASFARVAPRQSVIGCAFPSGNYECRWPRRVSALSR